MLWHCQYDSFNRMFHNAVRCSGCMVMNCCWIGTLAFFPTETKRVQTDASTRRNSMLHENMLITTYNSPLQFLCSKPCVSLTCHATLMDAASMIILLAALFASPVRGSIYNGGQVISPSTAEFFTRLLMPRGFRPMTEDEKTKFSQEGC